VLGCSTGIPDESVKKKENSIMAPRTRKCSRNGNSKSLNYHMNRSSIDYCHRLGDCSGYAYKFGAEPSYSNTETDDTARPVIRGNADRQIKNLSSSDTCSPEQKDKDIQSIENKVTNENMDTNYYNRVTGKRSKESANMMFDDIIGNTEQTKSASESYKSELEQRGASMEDAEQH
jgi:hypothetical protein